MKYLVLFTTILFCVEASIPSYFDVCCMDNTTTACTLNNINKGFQLALSGDDHHNVPSFLPVRLPAMTLLEGANAYFHLGTVRIYGLEGIVQSDLHLDVTHGTFKIKINIPQILILSTYEINATAGSKSYKSFGSSRITMVNVNVDQSFAFAADPNGYVFLQNAVLQYTAGQITYQLNNAAPQLTHLLNSPSNNLNHQFKPYITKTFNDIFTWRFRSLGELSKITEFFDFDCTS